MKRWLMLLFLLPQCTGCLAYAHPSVIYTPEQPLPTPNGSEHAFRVDVDRTERKPAPTSSEYTLMRIPLTANGIIPSQLEIAPTTGIYNPFGIGETKEHERSSYTMLVRVYRPAFRTIEIKAWDKTRELQWVAAPDLAAQERAIDDLLVDPALPVDHNMGSGPIRAKTLEEAAQLGQLTWWEHKELKSPPLGLQPGSVASSQRSALEFAASEYQRLANGPAASSQNMQAVRERLQQKAIWLRRYAEQPPVR
jgi:hypothetical protein